jgi:putative transposase
VKASSLNLELMRMIDERYMNHPEYGVPRMTDWLNDEGHCVNHKRVARLMKLMSIQAITPGPHTSRACPQHKKYPYLLRNVPIERVNQVWSMDITYIPMQQGYLYLTAVIEWFSRYVLAWDVSNSMETRFCTEALLSSLDRGRPEIFNTDQGSQFTSEDFTQELLDRNIAISMDGRGRALDNVFIERLWWSVKYEDVYPKSYRDGTALYRGLDQYFRYYNQERKHSSLEKKTPQEIYVAGGGQI